MDKTQWVVIGFNHNGDVVLTSPSESPALTGCRSIWVYSDVNPHTPDTLWYLTTTPQTVPGAELLRNRAAVPCWFVDGVSHLRAKVSAGEWFQDANDSPSTILRLTEAILEIFPQEYRGMQKERSGDQLSESLEGRRLMALLQKVPELALLEKCTDTNKITEARGMLRDILNSSN